MPSDLTIFALTEDSSADAAELCMLSGQQNAGGISIRFLERIETISPRAAAYKQQALDGDCPADLARNVSFWVRLDPLDRVLLVRHPDRQLADWCIDLLKRSWMADSRVVVVTTPALLAAHLPEGGRIAFLHMPTRSEENVRRSVEYGLTLLNSLGSSAKAQLPPQNSVRINRAPQLQGDNGQSHAILRSRSAPLRFAVPFVGDGFRLNTKIATERSNGVLISADAKGAALFGPYLPVDSGRYQAVAKISGLAKKSRLLSLTRRAGGTVVFDAYVGSVDKVLQTININAEELTVSPMLLELNFDVPALKSSAELELRIHQQSNCSFLIEWIELTWLE